MDPVPVCSTSFPIGFLHVTVLATDDTVLKFTAPMEGETKHAPCVLYLGQKLAFWVEICR